MRYTCGISLTECRQNLFRFFNLHSRLIRYHDGVIKEGADDSHELNDNEWRKNE